MQIGWGRAEPVETPTAKLLRFYDLYSREASRRRWAPGPALGAGPRRTDEHEAHGWSGGKGDHGKDLWRARKRAVAIPERRLGWPEEAQQEDRAASLAGAFAE